MKTKTVSMSRAIAALIIACSYTAYMAYVFGKDSLVNETFKRELEKAEYLMSNSLPR